jgi:hypothetical protein
MSKKTIFRQRDEAEILSEAAERTALEANATAPTGGKVLIERKVQINIRTTDLKRQQFERLRVLTRRSYGQIFDDALDALEAAWKEGKIR